MAKQIKEEWKDIPGYDGYYEISNTGRIRICNSGKILKQSDHTSGYKSVRLWNGSNYKNHYVHRLVAEAFIPNPDNKPTVNHKDENRKNNSANNLEWMTYLENNEYGNRKKKFILSRSKPVRAYDKYGNVVFEFEGTRSAERMLGINHTNIGRCANGKSKTAGGYIWEYTKGGVV